MDQSVSIIDQADVTSPAEGLATNSPGVSTDPLPVGAKAFSARRVDLPRVTAAVRHMVGSVEPSRMFSELAHMCVPAISDACTIDLVEEGGHRCRIRQPAENPWGNKGLGEHDHLVRAIPW